MTQICVTRARIGHDVLMAPPTRPGPPVDADGWFDAYFDGITIHVDEGFRSEVHSERSRDLAALSLRDALEGRYLPQQPVPLDLDQSWHILRVVVDSHFAAIGGGTLGATSEYRRPVRTLVQALLDHVHA
jgi:hypothetical protein